jgi:perosamine synthetase
MGRPSLDDRELKYLEECIRTGWISFQGPFVKQFESAVAQYCGTGFGISTTSGTTALHLALAALEIGVGDEVIIPALTMIATANAVTYTGARPVFADSEERTWNIDPKSVRSLISERTKAIIVVHLYGCPVDMDPIMEIARTHSLYVVEDAAEAFGSEYKERKVGSLGDIGCFSFYANKIITTGEGGMIVTRHTDIAQRALALRDHAYGEYEGEPRFLHRRLGYNYKMTNLQAAVGLAQMEKVQSFITKKRDIAKLYKAHLQDIDELILPVDVEYGKNVYSMYGVVLNESAPISPEMLRTALANRGVDTRSFFVPMHEQPLYATLGTSRCPVASWLSKRGLVLPSGYDLTSEDIGYICECIHSIVESGSTAYV